MTTRVIVPRLVDEANFNAQNLNARSLLSRFGGTQNQWHCACYGKADPTVTANRAVKITKVARRRLWPWHMALLYQQPADAIFYPGVEWFDWLGLQWRDRTRRSIPVIATLEGLAGGPAREEVVGRIAGHRVYCQPVSREVLERIDNVMQRADHIIAISPFIAKIGRELYGDKCSVLPIGVNLGMFAATRPLKSRQAKKVLSIGNVRPHKRPEVFLGLAERFPDTQFRWVGDGEQRSLLIADAARRGLHNLSYVGSLTRSQIADELRTAEVFVMPSKSEGVPKATQEAAASGVPCVVFGNYETPSVVNGKNGYVVWSDDELEQQLGKLLKSPDLRDEMGKKGSEIARAWDWNAVAPQWEQALLSIIEGRRSLSTQTA